jgi:hypothetical protein
VFTKVAEVIKETFGWNSSGKIGQLEEICYSRYTLRPNNLHKDWNTYGAAFLFCPEEQVGGDIVLLNPEGNIDLAASILMEESDFHLLLILTHALKQEIILISLKSTQQNK